MRTMLLGLALVTTASANAQARYRELRLEHIRRDGGNAQALAVADLDGDSALDLILAQRVQGSVATVLYANDGVARFLGVPRPVVGTQPNRIVTADFDADGDLDMFCATGTSQAPRASVLVRNDGATFTDVSAQMPTNVEHTMRALALDVDGDADLDLYLGVGPIWQGGQYGVFVGGQDRLLLNDGRGNFSAAGIGWLPTDTDFAYDVVAGDLDGDRDLDLIVAAASSASLNTGRLRIYENRGNRFAEASAGVPQSGLPLSVSLLDADGDGDLDILAGNLGQDRLLLNQGALTFTDATANLPIESHPTDFVLGADVDGDGDRDVLRAIAPTMAYDGVRTVQLWLNDGRARFTEASAGRLPPHFDLVHGLAGGDLDRDGDLDLAVACPYARNRVWLNDGRGQYLDGSRSALGGELPYDSTGVAAADFDGDGAPDLLLSVGRGGQSLLHLNDGRGAFRDATVGRLPIASRRATCVVAADVDGNGTVDALLGDDEGCQLLINNGAAVFTDESLRRLPPSLGAIGAAAFGDLDGDGDLDAVLGSANGGRVLINTGQGFFVDRTSTWLATTGLRIGQVVLADLDGDRDLDLLASGDFGRLFLNVGNSFQDATGNLPPDNLSCTAVAAGDVDRDGDLDVVWAGGWPVLQERLHLNDGRGRFVDVTTSHLPGDRSDTTSLAFCDVDGDGDLDLLLGNATQGVSSGPARNDLYLNDGAGRFAAVSAQWANPGPQYVSALACVDVDADGDADVCLADGRGFAFPRIDANLTRHLHAPFALQIGAPFELEIYANPGQAQVGDSAMVLVSPRAARLALPPFGILALDPATLVALGPVAIRAGDGTAAVALPLPRDRSWLGRPLFWQALVVPRSGAARLTNSLATTAW